MFHSKSDSTLITDDNIDEYGDSFARDVTLDELKGVSEVCH